MTDAELGFLIIIAGVVVVYVIPTVVAFARRHPNRWAIMVVNMLFGATGLGWFGSLIWAFSAVHRSPTGNHGGESGLNLFVNDRSGRVPTQAPADPADQLTRLKKLLDDGAITDDEYQVSRRPWLDALRRG